LPESKAHSTPIVFYGKVIDLEGDAVPDAIVNYRALDKFDAPGSTYEGKADATGSFSIRDIAGAVLSVAVSKGRLLYDRREIQGFICLRYWTR
jgi:hypothetical protein